MTATDRATATQSATATDLTATQACEVGTATEFGTATESGSAEFGTDAVDTIETVDVGQVGNVSVNTDNPLFSSYQGPSPVIQVVRDMLRRSLLLGPLAVVAGVLLWGVDAAASVVLAIAVVLINICLSALIISRCAKISYVAMAAGAMFGFLFRLGLIVGVVLAVRNQSWVNLVALCISIVIAHLGLLFWELRYISASLAFPGIKPGNSVKGTKEPK